MKTWDVEQNSDQWMALRRGMPTASEFHKIICAGEGTMYRCSECGGEYTRKRKKCDCGCAEFSEVSFVKPSAQADGYLYQLIAESMGGTDERPPNYWTERGHELEPQAIAEFEILTDSDTERVGFCTTDDGLLGCSPDRLIVGKRRLVEAKCPSPQVHVRHMIAGDLEDAHKVQVQGQLLVTGYEGVDVISYCPGFPSVIIPVERNEDFISGMNEILVEFVTKLHRTRAELIAKYGDFRRLPDTQSDPLNVSDADVEAILASRR